MAIEEICKIVGRHKYLIKIIKIKYFNHERDFHFYLNMANIW